MATEHFDLTPYSAVTTWFEKVKAQIPNYAKANGDGAGAFGAWVKMSK